MAPGTFQGGGYFARRMNYPAVAKRRVSLIVDIYSHTSVSQLANELQLDLAADLPIGSFEEVFYADATERERHWPVRAVGIPRPRRDLRGSRRHSSFPCLRTVRSMSRGSRDLTEDDSTWSTS